MMVCAVRRPQQCKAMIVYDGIVYGWVQVAIGSKVLCFCPEHDEAAKHALKLSEEHARRTQQRNNRLDEFHAHLTGRRA